MPSATPGWVVVGLGEPVLVAVRARADFRADGGAVGVDAGCLLLVERLALLAGGAARRAVGGSALRMPCAVRRRRRRCVAIAVVVNGLLGAVV